MRTVKKELWDEINDKNQLNDEMIERIKAALVEFQQTQGTGSKSSKTVTV